MGQTNKRRSFWPILRATFSIALLGWLLSRADIEQLRALWATADLRLWATGFGCAFTAWLINTAKWQMLLKVQGYHMPYLSLLGLNYIGMFYGILLPGQLSGEVMKGLRLARLGTPAGTTAVSIVVDRLTGLVALGILGLVGLLASPPPFAAEAFIWLTIVIGILAMVSLAILVAQASVKPRTDEPLSMLQALLYRASEALVAYRRSSVTLVLALALGLAFQALVIASNYLVAQAVDIDVSFLTLMWIVSLVSLVAMLPLSLGGLGLREGSFVLLLQQYGISFAQGLSLSLAVFGIILTQGIIGGVLEALWPKLTASSNGQTSATSAQSHP